VTERFSSAFLSATRRLANLPTVQAISRLTVRYRRPLVVAVHLGATAFASYFAFWLRFDGVIPAFEFRLFVRMLPWLIAIRGVAFIPFRLYEGLWRYTSIWDLRNLLAAVATSSIAFHVLVHQVFGIQEYPRSVSIIDAMLLIFLLGGIRLTQRFVTNLTQAPSRRRVLVYGAGDAGEMVLRDMLRLADYRPVGFIDDDRRKVGKRIHDVPVLGTRHDLPRVLAEQRPEEVLVAIPRADARTMREIVRVLEPYKLPITTVPHLRDLISGKIAISQIRPLSIEDLLPRAPVGIGAAPLNRFIRGKRVLVTGAGGSIGSELCRQIAELRPSLLVLYERHENSLYTVENNLRDLGSKVPVRAVIGDVTDEAHLDMVFRQERPQLVFHAAAHKHVPLMEGNACEAVKNNVKGTRLVAEAALRRGADRFVLISTDKAVNPSSVMGASKRVAELTIQAAAREGRTTFVTVRFGNVLGSNGSVVPRFLEQIKAGGPVTITHPEMRRYFMLISEAVQLVLHAAALGEASAVYTLDMGDQVKLLDMARNLIRLAGFVPDEDILIEFVGSRPGEKMSEELFASDERLQPSGVDKILKVQPINGCDLTTLKSELMELERLAASDAAPLVLAQLEHILPTFKPQFSRAVRAAALVAERETAAVAAGRRPRPAPTPAVATNWRTGTVDRRVIHRGGRRQTDRIGL
jgi:FlaA1/EpsC-like NDP-sugar epimerase